MNSRGITFISALVLSVMLMYGCGSSKTSADKEAVASEIREGLLNSDFRFEATYVYPTGFKSMYLSPYYDVEVKSDSVKVYLPYYGRAYKAPMDPMDGGYRFISTDFEYEVEQTDKKGNWRAILHFNDQGRAISFNFDVYENGSTHLNVIDTDRQPISFRGNLVIDDEE
ncbi:MAG: DUF4251 domain-containing protein [Fermentimonas sp.]|jgi:hypothetical protein